MRYICSNITAVDISGYLKMKIMNFRRVRVFAVTLTMVVLLVAIGGCAGETKNQITLYKSKISEQEILKIKLETLKEKEKNLHDLEKQSLIQKKVHHFLYLVYYTTVVAGNGAS